MFFFFFTSSIHVHNRNISVSLSERKSIRPVAAISPLVRAPVPAIGRTISPSSPATCVCASGIWRPRSSAPIAGCAASKVHVLTGGAVPIAGSKLRLSAALSAPAATSAPSSAASSAGKRCFCARMKKSRIFMATVTRIQIHGPLCMLTWIIRTLGGCATTRSTAPVAVHSSRKIDVSTFVAVPVPVAFPSSAHGTVLPTINSRERQIVSEEESSDRWIRTKNEPGLLQHQHRHRHRPRRERRLRMLEVEVHHIAPAGQLLPPRQVRLRGRR